LAELLEDSPLPAEPHTDRANSLLVELQHEFLFGVGRGL
jgi:hypothetical protein